MQLEKTTRPSEFPADTLRYLRRLANLTARYCDRVDAEKNEYTREKNYIYALRCIYRIQKTIYENELLVKDIEARVKVAGISDALFDAWDFLNDKRAFPICAYIGIIAVLAIKCVDNYELYKTSFDCILSQIKQYTN